MSVPVKSKTAQELGLKRTSWIPEHWNETQIEIWRGLDEHWDLLINKNVEEFIKYIHPTMVGYGHESPVPVDYGWLHKWVGFWTKSTNIAIAELRPTQIILHGDIAILQYLIFTVEVNSEGGKRVIRRYTMTWKKCDPKVSGGPLWQVIGSHNNLMDTHV